MTLEFRKVYCFLIFFSIWNLENVQKVDQMFGVSLSSLMFCHLYVGYVFSIEFLPNRVSICCSLSFIFFVEIRSVVNSSVHSVRFQMPQV